MEHHPRVLRCGALLLTSFASLALCAGQVAALDAPPRDTLIAQALRANPRLIAEAHELAAQRTHMRQAAAWDDPQAGIEFHNTPVTSWNPIRDGQETDVYVEQMIPFPGKRSRMRDAAGAGVHAMAEAVEEERRRVVADVKRAYVALFSAQRRIDVYDSTRILLQRSIDLATTQLAVGRATEVDVLRLRVELATLDNERAILVHDAHVPEAMINTLRDMTMDTLGRVAAPAVVPFAFEVDALVDSAMHHRHALREAALRVPMAEAERRAAAADRLPDFMIRGTYRGMAGMTDAYALMIGVSVPIAPWSSDKYDAREEEREEQVRAATAMARDKQNMVEFEVHDAWIRARAHWEESERYRTTIIPQAERAVQASLAAYGTGRIDVLSLLDGIRMLQMYRAAYYSSLSDYLTHVADLELACGVTLDGGAQ